MSFRLMASLPISSAAFFAVFVYVPYNTTKSEDSCAYIVFYLFNYCMVKIENKRIIMEKRGG